MTALDGTRPLTRLALRRDRIRLFAYVLGLAILWAAMLAAEAAQPYQALVEETEIFVSTPAVRIFGVASGVSVGATVLIRGYVVLGTLAALMSAQAVVRHTRQNEEAGRSELVGAGVVGRYAAPCRRAPRHGRRRCRAGCGSWLGGDRDRAAGCGVVRGGRRGRRPGHGVRRGRRGDRSAVLDHPGSRRPRRGVPRARIPGQRCREHARHGRRRAACAWRAHGLRGCLRWDGVSRCARTAGTTGGRSACPSSPSSCW